MAAGERRAAAPDQRVEARVRSRGDGANRSTHRSLKPVDDPTTSAR
jgi:hypothetical protein